MAVAYRAAQENLLYKLVLRIILTARKSSNYLLIVTAERFLNPFMNKKQAERMCESKVLFN